MDDSEFLRLIENDARASVSELSAMSGLSEREVEKKISCLKKKGVVRGFRTIVDWTKLDNRRACALVQVKVVPQAKLGFDRVCRNLSKDKRITDIAVVTGEYDLMVTVR
ncbi:MAG: hypothetical protein GF334_04615, partial [Candidatus Altiarchaeales archaeon]|nr:hypothetical protein [Candidatus Altiarchaeales archaeon]